MPNYSSSLKLRQKGQRAYGLPNVKNHRNEHNNQKRTKTTTKLPLWMSLRTFEDARDCIHPSFGLSWFAKLYFIRHSNYFSLCVTFAIDTSNYIARVIIMFAHLHIVFNGKTSHKYAHFNKGFFTLKFSQSEKKNCQQLAKNLMRSPNRITFIWWMDR